MELININYLLDLYETQMHWSGMAQQPWIHFASSMLGFVKIGKSNELLMFAKEINDSKYDWVVRCEKDVTLDE